MRSCESHKLSFLSSPLKGSLGSRRSLSGNWGCDSLYANETCDEHAVYFSAMIEMTRHVDHVLASSLAMM